MITRRNVLQAGLASGSLFLPLPYAWVWAQSEGALKLLKAPKQALVIGNGKYKDAPELKNAPNDAKAIGEVLKGAGFAVTMLLDTGRDALVQAIRDYVNGMEKQKAVGLFYFAGHGVQLEWRNYMLPVDAVIDKIDDVAKQSVDIARLMEGLGKATNPMNMIILDACRENPFGTAKPVAQKGLSQMDAPTHTILAYATSPGNVASDGDGVNGIYTENLLREMKVPEAKIEDVFKRVRLGVRRKTNGAQIPWESTSLEEDFWFIPPRELKKLSEDEKEKQFKVELALWERVRTATEPGPFEDYLRRYPNGQFSELAQLQLDRALAKQGEKKIVIAAQEGNPYTKGSAEANTQYKVGDSYTRRLIDVRYGKERTVTETITKVTENEVHYDSGRITDLLGNAVRLLDGRVVRGAQTIPFEYAVGKNWHTRFATGFPDGRLGESQFSYKVVTRENMTVPAGTFSAFRIEGGGPYIGPIPSGRLGEIRLEYKRWDAPGQLRYPLVAGEEVIRFQTQVVSHQRSELVAYKQT